MNPRILLMSLFLFLMNSCDVNQKTHTVALHKTPSPSLDWNALAQKIVERSNPQEGERVLLVGLPGKFDSLVLALENAIRHTESIYLGGISVSVIQPDSWSTEFTDRWLNSERQELSLLIDEVDLGIMLPGTTPADMPYKLLQDNLQSGIRRTIHFHWAGAYDLEGNLLEINDKIGALYEHVILNTDYDQLSKDQVLFEQAMRDAQVHVTTPAGTDLRFSIGDRPVTRQDGHADADRATKAKNLIDREIEIPAGVIRVAPIEESVLGTIAFPDALWDSVMVSGLVVEFELGKIVNINADMGRSAVLSELDKAGSSGRSFREFALGFNPLMPVQRNGMAWIPYYGYGAGIVRLSLGDNLELGGKVGGGYVRWNFFVDATVTVDGEVWVKDGVLIVDSKTTH